MWGCAAKILCLFLRNMVDNCGYFMPEQAKNIRQFLYCPTSYRVPQIDGKTSGLSAPGGISFKNTMHELRRKVFRT